MTLLAAAGLAISLTAGAALGAPTIDSHLQVSSPSPDGAAPTTPILLNDNGISWLRGTQGWVQLNFTTPADLDDVRITVSSSTAGVEILETTELFSGPMLQRNEIDAAAVQLSVGDTVSGSFDLDVSISSTDAGVTSTSSATIPVTVFEPTGGAYGFITDTIRISASASPQAGWIEFDYVGLATELDNFRVDVRSDLDIVHPQGAYTGLHHDERLSPGEHDVARVWIDPNQLVPDTTHALEVTTRFRSPGIEDWIEETILVALVVE